MKHMKKFILILLTVITFTSCDETRIQERVDLKAEIGNLRYERDNLTRSISNLRKTKTGLTKEVSELRTEKSAFTSGYEPVYLLTLEIKQSTFTLNLAEHAKNAMNAITLQIPVSYTFYNKVSIGQNISEEFKYGSLILNGDFSKLKVKVKDKEVKRSSF